MCVLSFDFDLSPGLLMLLFCSLNLVLKVLHVRPVYVSTFPDCVSVTQAEYTTAVDLHLPWTGHLSGPSTQLQPGCGLFSWFPFNTVLLCLEMAVHLLAL